jgi:hypothetical protein
MVYGEPLVLPGQFLNTSPPAADFLEQLRQNKGRFVPPVVRRGAPPAGLSPLYQGPYKVLLRGAKVFQVDIGGRREVISVDRLKPHMGTSASGASEERLASSRRGWRPRTASRVAECRAPS